MRTIIKIIMLVSMVTSFNLLNAYEVRNTGNISQATINRNNKEIEKLVSVTIQNIFKENLLKEIVDEDPEMAQSKKIMNELINSLSINIGKIQYTSNDSAILTYTIKVKNFVPNIDENTIAKRIEKKTGKSIEKVVESMSEKELEDLAFKATEELMIEQIKKSNDYKTFDDTIEINRNNGAWE